MRIGLIYPHFEFGTDPGAIREFALTAENLGYTHIGADDHVIGPNPNRPGGWTGWVTYQTTIMEPLVLFAFMAAVTRRIEFATCVLLLPQRQTVLVAKQTATLDRLCAGRLRLGIGIGWNEIEYISLAENFHNRGRRVNRANPTASPVMDTASCGLSLRRTQYPRCRDQPAAAPKTDPDLDWRSIRAGAKARGPPGGWLDAALSFARRSQTGDGHPG